MIRRCLRWRNPHDGPGVPGNVLCLCPNDHGGSACARFGLASNSILSMRRLERRSVSCLFGRGGMTRAGGRVVTGLIASSTPEKALEDGRFTPYPFATHIIRTLVCSLSRQRRGPRPRSEADAGDTCSVRRYAGESAWVIEATERIAEDKIALVTRSRIPWLCTVPFRNVALGRR